MRTDGATHLVTNDPAAALQFYEDCGREVIYKSLSGIRSIVRRVGTEQSVAASICCAHGPAQFQSFIPGGMCGCTLWATGCLRRACTPRPWTIATPAATDWMDVDGARDLAPCNRGGHACASRRELDLPLTGIDLKETPEGELLLLRGQSLSFGFIF